MTSPWLHIIGIGEDGWDGLSPDARTALRDADVIVGGKRHHRLASDLRGERITWPSPFRTLADDIGAMADRKVAVLVTGDPLWFSAGAYLAKKFEDNCIVYPQVSAFQLSAARMRWSLADVETLTVHGRPAEQIIPYFSDGARLLVLTQDGETPATVSRLLVQNGYAKSTLTVLGALGGPDESRTDGVAETWDQVAPEFHSLAITCIADGTRDPLPLTGLPDDAFEHDGQITKREIRTMTLGALAPRRGAVLWDIGAGSGSVGIEFMRAGRDAQAFAIERNEARADMARRNAVALGVPRLKVIQADANAGLADLPDPDAIFVGGGISRDVIDLCIPRLRNGGRLVANAVTLESETLLAALQSEMGGTLSRVAVSRAEPVGRLRGWRPMMPVTQWIFVK